VSTLADCEMCGMCFVRWKHGPAAVCKDCADMFVRFIDDTVLDDLDCCEDKDDTRDGDG